MRRHESCDMYDFTRVNLDLALQRRVDLRDADAGAASIG